MAKHLLIPQLIVQKYEFRWKKEVKNLEHTNTRIWEWIETKSKYNLENEGLVIKSTGANHQTHAKRT